MYQRVRKKMDKIPRDVLGQLLSFLSFSNKWNLRCTCQFFAAQSRTLPMYWGPTFRCFRKDDRTKIVLSEILYGARIIALTSGARGLEYLIHIQPQLKILNLSIDNEQALSQLYKFPNLEVLQIKNTYETCRSTLQWATTFKRLRGLSLGDVEVTLSLMPLIQLSHLSWLELRLANSMGFHHLSYVRTNIIFPLVECTIQTCLTSMHLGGDGISAEDTKLLLELLPTTKKNEPVTFHLEIALHSEDYRSSVIECVSVKKIQIPSHCSVSFSVWMQLNHDLDGVDVPCSVKYLFLQCAMTSVVPSFRLKNTQLKSFSI